MSPSDADDVYSGRSSNETGSIKITLLGMEIEEYGKSLEILPIKTNAQEGEDYSLTE